MLRQICARTGTGLSDGSVQKQSVCCASLFPGHLLCPSLCLHGLSCIIPTSGRALCAGLSNALRCLIQHKFEGQLFGVVFMWVRWGRSPVKIRFSSSPCTHWDATHMMLVFESEDPNSWRPGLWQALHATCTTHLPLVSLV